MNKTKSSPLQPELSIIILNYNTKQVLCECLDSIAAHGNPRWEVIVVDNASTDGSRELPHTYSWARWLLLDQNLGFAAGNNKGLALAKGKYLMLLNSDTEISDVSRLDEAVEYMRKSRDVGAVTPSVRLRDGSLDWASHRGTPTLWTAFTYGTGLEHILGGSILGRWFGGYHLTWKDLRIAHEVDAVTGAAMIVSRVVLEKVGGLDERFFMYGEDLDWCFRIRSAGFKIIYFPESVVLHKKGQSGIHKQERSLEDAEIKLRMKGYFFDTMLLFYDKHYRNKYPEWVRIIVQAAIRLIKRVKGA